MLAETPQPDGGLLLILILVLLGFLVAHVVVVSLGCFWAWRAGRGSQSALAGFLLVAAVEGLFIGIAVISLLEGSLNLYFGSAVVPLAAQVALYVGAGGGRATAGEPSR